MKENTERSNLDEKRSEPRAILDKYYSVQFRLNSVGPNYLFKLRDISSKGLCILVKEDSVVLKHLKVDDILTMEYKPPGLTDSSKTLKTQIGHISKSKEGRFTANYLVGLSIIDRN
jgi:hypothetical protein